MPEGCVRPRVWRLEPFESLALELRGTLRHHGGVQIDANITFLQGFDIERSRTFHAEGLHVTTKERTRQEAGLDG